MPVSTWKAPLFQLVSLHSTERREHVLLRRGELDMSVGLFVLLASRAGLATQHTEPAEVLAGTHLGTPFLCSSRHPFHLPLRITAVFEEASTREEVSLRRTPPSRPISHVLPPSRLSSPCLSLLFCRCA